VLVPWTRHLRELLEAHRLGSSIHGIDAGVEGMSPREVEREAMVVLDMVETIIDNSESIVGKSPLPVDKVLMLEDG
jgi:hypothetical protein